MAKSSYATALFLAGWAAEAAAAPPPTGPVTAEVAMRVYEERFGPPADTRCPETGRGTDEEIVICGRTGRRLQRLPLPIEREPGEIVRHVNEPDATGALAGEACIHSCYQPVTVNPIKVILAVPKVIRHILGRDD
ncbi:MAG: hypothetical protein JWO81_250 [Alphaproteobacteria bacterium]|nr:hypothetical protein [Alphaproteobacteria bacterium]